MREIREGKHTLHLTVSEVSVRIVDGAILLIRVLEQHSRRRTVCSSTKLDENGLSSYRVRGAR